VTESYNEHKWGAVYWHDDDDDDNNDVIFSGTLVLIRKVL